MKNYQVGFKGRYKLEAVKADGERRVLLDWFDNLILDAGLNRLGSGGAYTTCMVGTSSGAVSPIQTGLLAPLATTTNVTSTTAGVNSGAGYAWNRKSFRFGVGAATGSLNEVGVGWDGTNCFSRALTADSGGDPTTVVVQSDEFLDVTYELRMYWPTVDVTGVGAISGVNYNTVTRAATVGSWALATLIASGSSTGLTPPGDGTSFGTGALGAITADAGGTSLNSINLTYAQAYVNNSYERIYRASFDGSQGSSDISNFRFSTPFGIFKSSFAKVSDSTPIPKLISNSLTLDFRVTWARNVEFVGVNPSLGSLSAYGYRQETGGVSASAQASIEFRRDGTVYKVETPAAGGANVSTKIGDWFVPTTADVGDLHEIVFTSITSSAGATVDTNASSFSLLSTTRFISLGRTFTEVFDHTITATYTIRRFVNESSGTITLRIQRETFA